MTWLCVVAVGIVSLPVKSTCLFIFVSKGKIMRDACLWMSAKVCANASAFSASE